MRLERLEIAGFGRLGDLAVDLHPRLTLVVGPNEAGKSTIHRAIRAALYGIDSGGPGRATDRSDWSRWSPWGGGSYGVTLTYALADGRRLRVARRLDQREHTCQVVEIGGGDITDSLRVGRAVVPGQVHLGIDETVLCATACLGEDGLRPGGADGPSQRAPAVQEAIERLADSGDGVTTTEALERLREAARRVGTERRQATPLGRVSVRIHQLERQLEEVRQHHRETAAKEERLRQLEADAVLAEERRAEAERRWLLGRLAAMAAERADLATAAEQIAALGAEIQATERFARFPADLETRVLSVGASLGEARGRADESRCQAAAATEPLATVGRRRGEIAAGRQALGSPPRLDGEVRAAVADLVAQMQAVRLLRGDDDTASAIARRDALRRELAATGVCAEVSQVARSVEVLTGARAAAGRWRSALLPAAVAAAMLALAAGAALGAMVAGGGAAAALLAAALALLPARRRDRMERARARRQLVADCPGISLDHQGLERLGERLERAAHLQAELRREEIRLEALHAGRDGAAARLAALGIRALDVAARCGLETPSTDAEAAITGLVEAVAAADEATRRLSELEAEDDRLALRERDLESAAREAVTAEQEAHRLELVWARLLEGTGLDPALPVPEVVAAFRTACDERRRHEESRRRRDTLAQRSRQAGDAEALARLAAELELRLRDRGGDPADVAATPALGAPQLAELENEAEHARRSAHAAERQAAEVRSALTEARRSAISLADLEDELLACLAERDHLRGQLAALERAGALLQAATRGIHRDLAPRLAGSVTERLALLTQGRYSAVNVDTDHFEVGLLGAQRPDLVGLDVVSHGTREQVSLLLRLALAEVLSDGGEPVPLLLDEPLLSADPSRRDIALRFLWNLSATNQVVLSTSDPQMVGAALALAGGEVGVVDLRAGSAAPADQPARPPRALAGRPL